MKLAVLNSLSNDPSKAILAFYSEEDDVKHVAELESTGFCDAEEMASCLKYSVTSGKFANTCLLGCIHEQEGYLISLVNRKAMTYLKAKSLSPDYFIDPISCSCIVDITSDGVVSKAVLKSIGSIKIFIPKKLC
jgi:hypothetical protein